MLESGLLFIAALEVVKTRDNGRVPIVPRGLVDQGKIRAGVQRAERALDPDVIRIMYTFAEDVQGNISLFFRIIISDAVSTPAKLRETTQRIITRVHKEIKSQELGLQTYPTFAANQSRLCSGTQSGNGSRCRFRMISSNKRAI